MANERICDLNIQDSPNNFATLVGFDNGEAVQIPINIFPRQSDIPSNSGSGASIIDVDEFPSNPSTTAIYRNWQVMKAEWVYKGQIATDGGMTCEVVDTLPETGNVCYTGASMYSYYQRADGEVYGYVDTALSSQMSVPVGWYPAATLFGALGYAYNGMIDKIADASDSGYCILLTKKPFLYCFHNNGTDIEQTKILTSKDNRAEGGGIIYATELPSTPAQAIYVVTQNEVKKVEFYQSQILPSEMAYCEIVDTLPEVGNGAMDLTTEALYTYYLTTDGEIYGYVDDAISSAVGGEIPVGWYPVATLFGVVGTTYGGTITSMSEATDASALYALLTKQPKTRAYVPMSDGAFLELTSGIRTRFDEYSGTVSITEV